jgi:S-DNA-T family DNA segregation ATPase FtsK/SpoIIIE
MISPYPFSIGIRIIAPIGKRESKFLTKTDGSFHEKRDWFSQVSGSEMELPIALGKTISNETFVVDLAK